MLSFLTSASPAEAGALDRDGYLAALRASLEAGLDRRWRELNAEVERARSAATERVAAAEAQAAALVAAASMEAPVLPAWPPSTVVVPAAATPRPTQRTQAAAAPLVQSMWSRVAYVDVLLPAAAVVLVLALLFAWVG